MGIVILSTALGAPAGRDKVPNSPDILIVIKIADPGGVRVGPQHTQKMRYT